MRRAVPLLVLGIGTLIVGGLDGEELRAGLPAGQVTERSLIKQSHEVTVKLLGARYLAEKKSLLVRVVYEAHDYTRFRLGDPVLVVDGQQRNTKRSIADAGYWNGSVNRNQPMQTWVVAGIDSLPKRVDVEIPFLRLEEDQPQVLWDAVRVDGKKISLGTATSEFYDIEVRQIQFTQKDTWVKSSDGSASTRVDRPSIVFESSMKQKRKLPKSLYKAELLVSTPTGRLLYTTPASRRSLLWHFGSNGPQDVRLMLLLTHARERARFTFSGVRTEPLALPAFITDSDDERLKAHLGKEVTVRGHIGSGGIKRRGTDKEYHSLTFSGCLVTVMTTPEEIGHFPARSLRGYRSRIVEVTGILNRRTGSGYSIELSHPSRIKIVTRPSRPAATSR